jgi:CBS-domain-containing membrane protein
MEARDIMTKEVVVLTPDMSVGDASEMLLRYHIHGAPVVDEAGQLIGMVSLMDLVGRQGDTVLEIMNPDPVTAPVDASVQELAGLMLDQRVRRVPIVEGGRVAGIVSASDLIEVLLSLHEGPSDVTHAPAGQGGAGARARKPGSPPARVKRGARRRAR